MKNKDLDKSLEFNLRAKARFGEGEALNLGCYLKELIFKRIGIVIDSAITDLEYTKKILESVRKEKFEMIKIWTYNLGAEPDYNSLDRIKKVFLEKDDKPKVDCFVAIGGGSVIDFVKGLATLVVNPGEAINYRGFPTNINPSLPTIALPTTAGTGSEVTYNAVFINLEEKKKLGINTKNNFPVLSILDPFLTVSCPRAVTISSGLDTLVHCIEGYASKKSNILTKVFAKEGFGLIFNNLAKVLDKPKDSKIRTNMQLGAYLGGLTLLGSGGGPLGALSYALGAKFNVPHGLAGGFFLPYILKHNIKNGYNYSQLYDVLEGSDKSLPNRRKNNLLLEKTFSLYKKIGVVSNLRYFGVDNNNIGLLLKEVENFEKAFWQNPVLFSIEDGKKLLINLI
jgi:alcohol dehydrogenase